MPRSIQEIIEHADELAARLGALRAVARRRASGRGYLLERAPSPEPGRRQVMDAVTTTARRGVSWRRIGELLGTSAQAAQQRYGPAIDAT